MHRGGVHLQLGFADQRGDLIKTAILTVRLRSATNEYRETLEFSQYEFVALRIRPARTQG